MNMASTWQILKREPINKCLNLVFSFILSLKTSNLSMTRPTSATTNN